jgi:hypothetical protein
MQMGGSMPFSAISLEHCLASGVSFTRRSHPTTFTGSVCVTGPDGLQGFLGPQWLARPWLEPFEAPSVGSREPFRLSRHFVSR